jgi:hypothetical protein
MEESKLTEVRLHSISPACFLLILEYVYCGAVAYQAEQAAELLRTADLFLLFDLRNECAAFLNKRVRGVHLLSDLSSPPSSNSCTIVFVAVASLCPLTCG